MDTKKYDEYGIPKLLKGEPIYKYYARLDKCIFEAHVEKRNKILEFINIWFSYRYPDKNYFQKIWYFRDIYYGRMPDSSKSKEFLQKYFNEYNEYFKLDLEYDEELFTSYNVLYMIELMLRTIKGNLKKNVIRQKAKSY